MEVSINKKELRNMIKNHYENKIGISNVRVYFSSRKEKTNSLCFSSGDPLYYAVTTVTVEGSFSHKEKVFPFYEEVNMEKINDIMLENFDTEKYDISNVSLDNGVEFCLFSRDGYKPYFYGVTLDVKEKAKVNFKIPI